jgi:hypothetical protein
MRGASDHAQAIAISQGAPNKSDSQSASMCSECLAPATSRRVCATCLQHFYSFDSLDPRRGTREVGANTMRNDEGAR